MIRDQDSADAAEGDVLIETAPASDRPSGGAAAGEMDLRPNPQGAGSISSLDAASRAERAEEELYRSLKREAGVRAKLGAAERDNRTATQFASVLNAILDRYQDAAGAEPDLAEPPPVFDERRYLNLHPDVKAAVAAGHVRSGFEHFVRYGRREGRQWQ